MQGWKRRGWTTHIGGLEGEGAQGEEAEAVGTPCAARHLRAPAKLVEVRLSLLDDHERVEGLTAVVVAEVGAALVLAGQVVLDPQARRLRTAKL